LVRELDQKLAHQRQQVDAVMSALLVAGSRALAERLKEEESKLADLEARRAPALQQRPKILPHVRAIARYVQELADALEAGDVANVRGMLRRALEPFRMVVDGDGYLLRGAMDLVAPLGVCDESSTGGALPGTTHTLVPFEVVAA
jgi:hypothetical protein